MNIKSTKYKKSIHFPLKKERKGSLLPMLLLLLFSFCFADSQFELLDHGTPLSLFPEISVGNSSCTLVFTSQSAFVVTRVDIEGASQV